MLVCSLSVSLLFFFFNDPATTEIYTLSLHDALPISGSAVDDQLVGLLRHLRIEVIHEHPQRGFLRPRSEEHTSELQSRQYLVCRLLLEKKNKFTSPSHKYSQILANHCGRQTSIRRSS